MESPSSKKVIWQAVHALMQVHYGEENLLRLSKDVGVGIGSASRLKAQETSVGIDLVDKIAAKFNVEPWQLLVPGFDARTPPTLLQNSSMALDVARLLDAMQDEDQKRKAYALIVQLVEFGFHRAAPEGSSPLSSREESSAVGRSPNISAAAFGKGASTAPSSTPE